MLVAFTGYATNYTSAVAAGNWSTPATWNPLGIPGSGDNVVIHGGNVVTVDGAYTCNNLDLGDATAGTTTLSIALAGNSLTVNGNLRINPNSTANIYTLNAGPGAINIAGTFNTWGTAGTDAIKLSTGSITFTPAIAITNANQSIAFTGAGTVNFNSSFTDNYNKLTLFAGAVVNFSSSYTVGTTNASWAGLGTANFTGSSCSIIANSNLNLFNIQVPAAESLTLTSGTGAVVIGGALTIGAGSTFTANENFEIDGNWTNNGGVFNGGSNTVTFNGTTTLTGATAFGNIQLGNTVTSVITALTINNSVTCTGLIFNGYNKGRTLTVSAGDSLIINGNLFFNQPTAAVINTLAINTGTCIITGNLTFLGTSATAGYASKAMVTTGLLSVAGTVSYDANTTAANQVITATTGTLTFSQPVNLAYGTLSITSTGIINFNGSSPSFTLGGASSPVFTTTAGCAINIKNGFINNTNAIVFNATSTTTLTGNGAITPNANITFGIVKNNASTNDTLKAGAGNVIIAGAFTLAAGSNFTAYNNFEVDGNWTNNGGTLTGVNDTVILNGAAQTIGGTSSTTFPSLQFGTSASAITVACTMNNSNWCTNLIFNGFTNSRTLTLAAGTTLTATGDFTMNQPTAALANTLNVNTAALNVSGNLNFVGTNNTATFIAKNAVTTGSFTLGGTINWMNNTAVTTEVITATTGTLTFNSPITMSSGSGTLSVTGAGTINFNGTSSTSFTFGGVATSPVFTTAAACLLNFANGFTNNTNALVFNATSVTTLTGNGSITPNATITFGIVKNNASTYDTLKAGAGNVIVAGTFTLAAGSNFTAYNNFEVDGNWTNNGGTLTGVNDTVILNGAAQTIGGTASTTFPSLQIGSTASAVIVVITMNNSNSCTNLIFNGSTKARTLTLAAGTTLTATGDLTMNQPTVAGSNTLNVNTATCSIAGNLNFVGTTSTATFITKIAVTTGAFTLGGTITWMSNTLVATEVITVTTGTLTFNSPISMGTGSGTLSVTSTGTINFNGTTGPSFTFGGAATSPIFTTTAGCAIKFANGFINNTNAIVFNATSVTTLTGNGAITPNANITFGTLQTSASTRDTLNAATGTVIVAGPLTLAAGSNFTINQNITIASNWVNNGGTVSSGTYAFMMNGAAQTIGGTSSTAFGILQIGSPVSAVVVSCTMNNNNTCSSLVFHAGSTARTFTLASGTTLAVSNDVTVNQPAAAGTNTFAINAGACTIGGNLILPVLPTLPLL